MWSERTGGAAAGVGAAVAAVGALVAGVGPLVTFLVARETAVLADLRRGGVANVQERVSARLHQ